MSERISPSDEARYPNLAATRYRKTSGKDQRYNCVSWAADWETFRWWEPSPNGTRTAGKYWPPNVPEGFYVENYMRAFGTLGYEPCDSADLEHGFEKIALYRGELDLFSHVAKQLPDGEWTSKLGSGNDIVHRSVNAFEGSHYGSPVRFMKRRVKELELPENLKV